MKYLKQLYQFTLGKPVVGKQQRRVIDLSHSNCFPEEFPEGAYGAPNPQQSIGSKVRQPVLSLVKGSRK